MRPAGILRFVGCPDGFFPVALPAMCFPVVLGRVGPYQETILAGSRVVD